MVWEDIEEDERDLLESVDYDARRRFYTASSRSLTFFVVASLIMLVLMFVACWFLFM